MAWFSVHESLYGPKLREMYHCLGCSEFEAVGVLNALWSWGLSNADKDGFMPYAGKEEIERYLYSKAAGSTLVPKDIVDALLATGWLDETDRGLFIHDWDTWQEQWYKAMERRENDARRKRESRKRAGEQRAEQTAPVSDDVVAAPPEPVKAREYTKEFEEFWAAYPKHEGKGEAYKKYQARIRDGFSPTELLTAAQNYAMRCNRQHTEQKYIKHGKTFLSENTPFTDYLPRDNDGGSVAVANGDNPFARYLEDS